jgi:hypothetical protein
MSENLGGVQASHYSTDSGVTASYRHRAETSSRNHIGSRSHARVRKHNTVIPQYSILLLVGHGKHKLEPTNSASSSFHKRSARDWAAETTQCIFVARKDKLPQAKIQALEQFVMFGRKGKQKEKEKETQRITEVWPNSTWCRLRHMKPCLSCV